MPITIMIMMMMIMMIIIINNNNKLYLSQLISPIGDQHSARFTPNCQFPKGERPGLK